jgi:hypothetical protein
MAEEDFGPLTKLDDVQNLLVGERGSMYAQHSDSSTTGYREPSDRKGTGKQIQGRSAKTLFMEPKAAQALSTWVDDEYIGTKLKPVLGADNKLSHVEVHATDDVPRRNVKAGDVLSKIPASTQAQVGYRPVEIGAKGFESPLGSKTGNNIHWGSPIAAIMPSPQKAMADRLNSNLQQSHGQVIQSPIIPIRRLAKGGAIQMPSSYSDGNWKLI